MRLLKMASLLAGVAMLTGLGRSGSGASGGDACYNCVIIDEGAGCSAGGTHDSCLARCTGDYCVCNHSGSCGETLLQSGAITPSGGVVRESMVITVADETTRACNGVIVQRSYSAADVQALERHTLKITI